MIPTKRKYQTQDAGKRKHDEEGVLSEATAAPKSASGWKHGGTKFAKHGLTVGVLSFITKEPPRAPEDPAEEEGAAEGGGKKARRGPTGFNFGPRDTILWPPMPAELFRAKTRMHDKSYASHYMHYWFEEHQGMPVQPPPPPLSGKKPRTPNYFFAPN